MQKRTAPKSVMLPWERFVDLVRYHVAGETDPEIDARLRLWAQEKMSALTERIEYASTHTLSTKDTRA